MEQYTPPQRAVIVQLYIQNNFSIVKTQRAYRAKYRVKKAPSDHTIRHLHQKFLADLTAPDFFLWGFLKSKVYVNKPRTLEALKDNIRREMAAIEPETLQKVMENAEKRAIPPSALAVAIYAI
ncbi:uncharacterized protein [Mycetomoellerius zeteki]|uniref:uncharacterized protein n=1 Tax=Mycetomoellerius zeteki TaxID=64791 RepID=UPI00084E66F9|nr:PREDICTED: uncharacterized protein LOC108730381 [Trachymyrmex zeteki]